MSTLSARLTLDINIIFAGSQLAKNC